MQSYCTVDGKQLRLPTVLILPILFAFCGTKFKLKPYSHGTLKNQHHLLPLPLPPIWFGLGLLTVRQPKNSPRWSQNHFIRQMDSLLLIYSPVLSEVSSIKRSVAVPWYAHL